MVRLEDYQIRFTTNALAELETIKGRSFASIAQDFETGEMSIRDLRTLVMLGVQYGSVPRKKFSEIDAGDLIDRVGLGRIGEVLKEAFLEAFPIPDAEVEEEGIEDLKN